MARLARADLFDPAEVSVFHCLNRCVRRCFLCGDDPLTGKNFDHRKAWLETRLKFLAGQFGIDILRGEKMQSKPALAFGVLFRRRTAPFWRRSSLSAAPTSTG